MAPSVFHPFARLSVELRLRIWEAACIGSPASHPGLQYINVRNDEAVPLPCDWPKASGQISTTKVNRSAYLIDGGLWRACKESRKVMAEYAHFEDWARSADWSGGNGSPHPAIIDTCHGEEECRMLVYPANDIFCIQVDDWIDLKEQGSDPKIYMPPLGYKRNDDDDDDDEDDYRDNQKLLVKNIALEFDGSWLVDLPNHVYHLADENSARGYLTNLLKQKAYHCQLFDIDMGMYMDMDMEREVIWIVDKEAKWFDNADEHHDTVYRDCDGEYIEVSFDDYVRSNLGDGPVPNAAKFLGQLERMDFEDFYPQPESPGGFFGPYGPEPKKMVRLLLRRENELKKTTERCKYKCDRLGWCICSDDEGDWWEDADEDIDLKPWQDMV
ncbi:hypothetical protein ACHAPU_003667 [Fusarium lateritium]